MAKVHPHNKFPDSQCFILGERYAPADRPKSQPVTREPSDLASCSRRMPPFPIIFSLAWSTHQFVSDASFPKRFLPWLGQRSNSCPQPSRAHSRAIAAVPCFPPPHGRRLLRPRLLAVLPSVSRRRSLPSSSILVAALPSKPDAISSTVRL